MLWAAGRVCAGTVGLNGAAEGTAWPSSEMRGGFRRAPPQTSTGLARACERMVAWGRLGSSSGGAGYGGALGAAAPPVSSEVAESAELKASKGSV